jgi:hypothetical protein
MFENETMLEFTSKFLSIIISTNKVVFTSIHTMKVKGRPHEILFHIYLVFLSDCIYIFLCHLKADILWFKHQYL